MRISYISNACLHRNLNLFLIKILRKRKIITGEKKEIYKINKKLNQQFKHKIQF